MSSLLPPGGLRGFCFLRGGMGVPAPRGSTFRVCSAGRLSLLLTLPFLGFSFGAPGWGCERLSADDSLTLTFSHLSVALRVGLGLPLAAAATLELLREKVEDHEGLPGVPCAAPGPAISMGDAKHPEPGRLMVSFGVRGGVLEGIDASESLSETSAW